MALPTAFGLPFPPSGLGAPVGVDQTAFTVGGLSQHPAIPALVFNSDTVTNSPTGTTNITIASVSLPAGILHPNTASPGLSGNLRRIWVRAYFQGANNVNAKTAGIAFGLVTNTVGRVLLTASVVSTGIVEADFTVDTGTTQTGMGWGLAATSAVGGAVTAAVNIPVALTLNLANAQSIFFQAVTQTAAADIILNGFEVVVF